MKRNKPDRLTTTMAKREKTPMCPAPTKQVIYRATPAITEITAVAAMQATCPALMKQGTCRAITEKTVAPAKQVMYQMVTERPVTCPVPTAKRLFPAMTLPYAVRRQPQPAPLRWKETVEAILMMRKMMSSR